MNMFDIEYIQDQVDINKPLFKNNFLFLLGDSQGGLMVRSISNENIDIVGYLIT